MHFRFNNPGVRHQLSLGESAVYNIKTNISTFWGAWKLKVWVEIDTMWVLHHRRPSEGQEGRGSFIHENGVNLVSIWCQLNGVERQSVIWFQIALGIVRLKVRATSSRAATVVWKWNKLIILNIFVGHNFLSFFEGGEERLLYREWINLITRSKQIFVTY